MKPQVLIYQPEKSAMQSGISKSQKWFMKFTNYTTEHSQYIFDIMNWVGSENNLKTISIPFESLETAINFATKNNLDYTISKSGTRIVRRKSYADNFK